MKNIYTKSNKFILLKPNHWYQNLRHLCMSWIPFYYEFKTLMFLAGSTMSCSSFQDFSQSCFNGLICKLHIHLVSVVTDQIWLILADHFLPELYLFRILKYLVFQLFLYHASKDLIDNIHLHEYFTCQVHFQFWQIPFKNSCFPCKANFTYEQNLIHVPMFKLIYISWGWSAVTNHG